MADRRPSVLATLAGVVLLGGLTVGEASIPRNSATFPIAHRTAPGASSLAVTLDSQSVNDLYYDPTDSAGHWLAFLTLNPGSHTLSVNAFTNTVLAGGATNTFTSLGTPQTALTTYDGRGHAVKRVFLSNGSQQTQTLTWDGAGRLTAVSQRDQTSNNGYDWTALYDGLGRRLRTVYTPVDGGVACPKLSVTQESWYDPEVEFLELGVSVNGQKHWKMYGPDLDGVYGGLQGIGGLEAIFSGQWSAVSGQWSWNVTPVVNDAFGNAVASVTNSTVVVWNPTRVGGYGPLPGSSAAWLSTNTTLAAATVWRGKRMDPTGYYWQGARYYDPVGGRFLSPDPMGHEASMDLYSYANGDPINECDPDGRFGKNATSSRLDDPFSQGMIQSYNQEREAQINQEAQWKDSDIQWKEPTGPNYYVSPTERVMSAIFHSFPGTMQLLGAMESVSGQNPLTLEPVDRGEAMMTTMLSMMPLGGVGGAVGRGGVKSLGGMVGRTELRLASSAVRTFAAENMASGSRVAGALYDSAKLQRLGNYLRRDGIELVLNADARLNAQNAAGMFRALPSGSGQLYLPSNPTVSEVYHELSHYLHFKSLDFNLAKYSKVGRFGREGEVYQRLIKNRQWKTFRPLEQEQHFNSWMKAAD